MRVGYVLKRYPRFSETFIVTEILAHEAAGMEIEIFSLRAPEEAHFQDAIARVRAPVTYLMSEGLKAVDFWSAMGQASQEVPDLWADLEMAREHDVREVYQAVRLAELVRQKGIDHLHAHFASSATTVARLTGLFASIPYTFTAHAKDIFHQDVDPVDFRRKLNDAAAAITVSDYNLAFLRDTYGEAAGRVRRIYNCLEIERFQYQEPFDRPPVVIAVGRLVEKKGFVELIEACELLDQCGLDFTCQIIGSGELEADLHKLIEGRGLSSRVSLLGALPQYHVLQLVSRAAVLAAPCVIGEDGNRDGLPTVLIEAMALGTPCVSTDVTGIPEVLLDGETGLQVPQRDPKALAEAIESLLLDPPLRVHLARQARQLIENMFDHRRNAEEIRGVFQPASMLDLRVNQAAW